MLLFSNIIISHIQSDKQTTVISNISNSFYNIEVGFCQTVDLLRWQNGQNERRMWYNIFQHKKQHTKNDLNQMYEDPKWRI